MITQKKLDRRRRRKSTSGRKSTANVAKEASPVERRPIPTPKDRVDQEDINERAEETPILTPHPVSELMQNRKQEHNWTPRDVHVLRDTENASGDMSRGNSSLSHTAHLTPVASGRITVAPIQSMIVLLYIF